MIRRSAELLFELVVSAIEITPEALRVRSNSCLMKLLGSSDSRLGVSDCFRYIDDPVAVLDSIATNVGIVVEVDTDVDLSAALVKARNSNPTWV